MKGNGLDALAALCATGKANPEANGGSTASAAPGGNTQPTNAPTSQATSAPQILPNTAVPGGTQNIAPQQVQQAVAMPFVNPAANPAAASMAAFVMAANPQGVAPGDPAMINAMQQLAFQQYSMQMAQAAAAQAQNRTQQQQVPILDVTKSAVPVPLPGQAPALPQKPGTSNNSMAPTQPQQGAQLLPQPPASREAPAPAPSSTPTTSAANSMQPPPPPSQVLSSQSSLTPNRLLLSTPAPAPAVLLKPSQQVIAQRPSADAASSSSESLQSYEDKKQLKRAANRRSAQLSRKRKKQYIDQLKEENDDLKRKEQILRSIPDLIVVFDSSGKLWFVSHSVSRFLDFSPKELEGASFWDRLCEESVRLLKAAFMDALAARKDGMETTPLGSGVWELRLVDKDGSHKVITLNGVVHFKGESPECVCSIRPLSLEEDRAGLPSLRNVSVSSGSTGNSVPGSIRPTIKPQQSAISNISDESSRAARISKARAIGRRAAQISDGDSGSICSESGSASDE